MKLIIFTALIAVAFAKHLDNTYLPPSNVKTVADNGDFLNTPLLRRNYVGFGNEYPLRKYGAPGYYNGRYSGPYNQRFVRPASVYDTHSPNHVYQGHEHDGRFYNYAHHPLNGYGVPSGHYSHPAYNGRHYGTQSRDAGAAILHLDNENNGDGSYKFAFETQNGIARKEAGELKNVGTHHEASSVQGAYKYVGDDGQTYAVKYLADENGFQPFGKHIEPISKAVQTSLQKNAAEAQRGYPHDGQGLGSRYYYHPNNRHYYAPNKSVFDQHSGYHY